MEVSFTAVQAANKVLIIAGVIKLYKDIYTDMLIVLYTRRYFYRRSNYFYKIVKKVFNIVNFYVIILLYYSVILKRG